MNQVPPPPLFIAPPLPPPFLLTDKISPAALRGISNSTTVPQCQKSVVRSAIKRLVNFHPDLSYHDFLCYHTPTPARLQEGPQCGLVVLSMATSHFTTKPDGILPDALVDVAKERGYTKLGEMFSVDDMAALAREVLEDGVAVTIEQIEELLNNKHMIQCLGTGDMFLVPYDCDLNHEPCLARGKKAHWGLVTGFVIAVKNERNDHINDKEVLVVKDAENKQIFHFSELSKEGLSQLPEMVDLSENRLLLLARQSKSLCLGAWRIGLLVNSCQNLKEIDPKREAEIERYQIPDGGIEAGLAGRMIHLSKKM